MCFRGCVFCTWCASVHTHARAPCVSPCEHACYYARMSAFIRAPMCVHVLACMLCMCFYKSMYECIGVYTCICLCLYVRLLEYICFCVCVLICVLHIHTYRVCFGACHMCMCVCVYFTFVCPILFKCISCIRT